MNETAPLRVLVVDDSALMRKLVSDILRRNDIEVVGTARDGCDALDKAQNLQPDVITLDVEMPRMDGAAFLGTLMRERPTPVVMVSSLTQAGAEITLRCLELGAFDCVCKPSGSISLDIERSADELVAKVRAAATAGVRRAALGVRRPSSPQAAEQAGAPKAAARPLSTQDAVVVIASSTGGPAALTRVVPSLPGDLAAAILVVQHLPIGFTRSLANRLDTLSALTVREASEGDQLQRGVALIAPAGKHLALDAQGRVTLNEEPPLWGVRPAADVTLRSAAARFGARVVAVVMTGMGRDGALGAKAVRQAGGVCFAQDEATCVVFGMPRAAQEAGAVNRLLPLDSIATAIAEHCQGRDA